MHREAQSIMPPTHFRIDEGDVELLADLVVEAIEASLTRSNGDRSRPALIGSSSRPHAGRKQTEGVRVSGFRFGTAPPPSSSLENVSGHWPRPGSRDRTQFHP